MMRWLHRFQYVYHALMAGTALAADNSAIDAVFDDSNLGEAIKHRAPNWKPAITASRPHQTITAYNHSSSNGPISDALPFLNGAF